MTPFGIRKKLKSMLDSSGSGPSAPPVEIPRFPVTFVLPDGDTYEAEAKKSDSLVLTSGRGAIPIATGCGDGTCGTCQVEVLEGADNLAPEISYETDTKKNNDVPEEYRLGCHARVIGPGVKVRIINIYTEEMTG
jgi:ferredoxin